MLLVRLQGFILLILMLTGACILDWPEPGSDPDGDGDVDTDVDGDTDADGDTDVDGDGDGDVDGDGDTDVDGDGDSDADVPEDVIPRASPNVDGNLGEWGTLRHSLTAANAGYTEGSQSNPGASDISVAFDFRWDDTNLYLGARITDDSAGTDGPQYWDDDSIEFYVDGDDDGSPAFDANDHQYNVTRNGDIHDNTAGPGGANASTDGGNPSWVLEMAVPWSALGGSPSPGRGIGADLAANDDDDGGEIETYAVRWSSTSPWRDHSEGFRSFTLGD
jgi:hypothetical protein